MERLGRALRRTVFIPEVFMTLLAICAFLWGDTFDVVHWLVWVLPLHLTLRYSDVGGERWLGLHYGIVKDWLFMRAVIWLFGFGPYMQVLLAFAGHVRVAAILIWDPAVVARFWPAR
jgi:hypothetical protein